jgi:hypothetical protein
MFVFGRDERDYNRSMQEFNKNPNQIKSRKPKRWKLVTDEVKKNFHLVMTHVRKGCFEDPPGHEPFTEVR